MVSYNPVSVCLSCLYPDMTDLLFKTMSKSLGENQNLLLLLTKSQEIFCILMGFL